MYEHPKILLIDVDSKVESDLRNFGYSVVTGSLGNPYRVPKSDKWGPVIMNGDLPKDSTECEVIIVDLADPKILVGPAGTKHTTSGERDVWAKCTTGIIDPRPRFAQRFSSRFNRILLNGGLFVIFTGVHRVEEYGEGYEEDNRLRIQSQYEARDWDLLDLLSRHVRRFSDAGTEMEVVSQAKEPLKSLSLALKKHLATGRFDCTIHNEHFGEPWIPIVKQKYDNDVGVLIKPHMNTKGSVFIFPQLGDQNEFIVRMIREILPEFAPNLFPDHRSRKWVHSPEYEHPTILEHQARIAEISRATESSITAIRGEIREEESKFDYTHALLTETGTALRLAVIKTLRELGFEQVVDMDEELAKQRASAEIHEPRREDIQIRDDPPLLLIEVKGITGLPADAEALQCAKYLAPRIQQLNRIDIKAMSIVNHQRNIPPLDRENKMPFRKDILDNAEHQKFGLLTTFDLFRLIRGFFRNRWSHSDVRALFYKTGRIDPIPAHYELIGSIEKYWDNVPAVGMKLSQGELHKGDRISFVLPIEYLEQEVVSMEADHEAIDHAEAGMLTAIKTEFPKSQLRARIPVYRVERRL